MTQPVEITSGAATFEDAMAWRASQVEEYSSWVAAQDIYVGNGLAYNAGDPVPASNVVKFDYDSRGLVRRPDGWTDPVPGDGIEDEPQPKTDVATAPSNVDDGPTAVAVKRTPSGKR